MFCVCVCYFISFLITQEVYKKQKSDFFLINFLAMYFVWSNRQVNINFGN